MDIETRKRIENAIVRKAVESAIAAGLDVGCYVSNDDSEVLRTNDAAAILAELGAADIEMLMFFAKDAKRHFGYVELYYGESGYDVITDYTMNVESIIQPALQLAEDFELELDERGEL